MKIFKNKKIWLWGGGIAIVMLLAFFMLATVSLGLLGSAGSYAESADYGGGYAYDAVGGDDGYYLEEAEADYDMARVADAPAEPVFFDEQTKLDTSTGNVAPQSAEAGQQQVERLIIRTGEISLSSDDTRAAQESIEAVVKQLAGDGAFIVNRDESGGSDEFSPYISMQIRVPVESFDEVMDSIAELAVDGTTPSRSEHGQDVTEEYVDLAARMESLEAARERLLELMKNAETTEALLLAEAQLTQREVEIESIKGRLQYLSESARLSSIYINLQPYSLSQPVDTSWRPAETVRYAFEDLIRGLRNFADFLIVFVIARLIWFVLFGGLIFYAVRWIVRKVRVNSSNEETDEA